MANISDLLNKYAILKDTIESIRAELPQLDLAEKELEEVKKQIQDHVKVNGEVKGSGYEVKLSRRYSWDTKALEGYALAHADILALRSEATVATIKKAKP